jgi:hypothetical protein
LDPRAHADPTRIHTNDVEPRPDGIGEGGHAPRLGGDEIRGQSARSAGVKDQAADALIGIGGGEAIHADRDLLTGGVGIVERHGQRGAFKHRSAVHGGWCGGTIGRAGSPVETGGRRLSAGVMHAADPKAKQDNRHQKEASEHVTKHRISFVYSNQS